MSTGTTPPILNTNSTSHAITVGSIPFDVVSVTYAMLVAAGGILGYVKAKSIPSLAAGLAFGAILGTGSYLEATKDNYWVTFAGSGALAAMMGQRFLRSRKFMPAGLITTLSLGMILRYSIYTIQDQTNNKK